MTVMDEGDHLAHYGILRRSGRYPWGSGGNSSTPAQRSRKFLDIVASLKEKGMSEEQIAKGFGMTTTQLRDARSIARSEQKLSDIAMANRLKAKGMSNVEIGKRMGRPESTVRNLLADGEKEKVSILASTSDMLRNQVKEKTYIQVGEGVANSIGVSAEKLRASIAILRDEGYEVHSVQVPQTPGSNQKTTVKVLAPPGHTYKDVVTNMDKIQLIQQFSDDGGRSFAFGIEPPLSVHPSRLQIKYSEDGGDKADGVIYVRPGKDDISLGGAHYAQVRVQVGDGHYLKGMAIYKDDLPTGVDLQFNTNKSKKDIGTDKMAALKKLEDDPENPFGSMVRQIYKKDENGIPRRELGVSSAMNLVNEEGKWDTWSNTLSSQMLSKQSPTLAKQQLDRAYQSRKAELDEIMSLTNPAVKQKLLQSFSDDADAAAVHLKAAALPRQRNQVILPINSLKETEVYAPNFKPGEKVVLIRHPHGGTFEIPELTVNNRNAEGRKLLGNAPDAIGINSEVAKRLSGADFDGDTVLVIPNPATGGRIKTTAALKQLRDFDPQRDYKLPEGQKFKGNKQQMMGDVSNLITDMTIQGAKFDDIAKAVKHSMVVIDAEKHDLDWKRSAIENSIPSLKEKYQGAKNAGASTLISRASSRQDVPSRKQLSGKKGIDPETGKKVYVRNKPDYVNKKGQLVTPMQRSKKLAETDDARTLLSKDGGTVIERVYADHSNKLKALANTARKEMIRTESLPYSPSAAKHYANEVAQLNAKLNIALKNKPLERQARLIADATVSERRRANPSMDRDEIKKLSYRALEVARVRTGAQRKTIKIEPQEWDAIQAGAIRPT